jgi:MFS family permease
LALPYSISLVVANSIFGRLVDSYGRRPFLLTGLLASAITTAFFVFPSTFTVFFVARLLNGLTLGMFPAAIVSIASDRRTPMGVISSWRALGWAIGALLNGLLSILFELKVAFLVGSLLFFVAFVLALIRDTGGKADTINQRNLSISGVNPNYWTVLRQNWQVYLTIILRHGSGGSIWIYWTLFLKFNLDLNDFQIGVVLATNTVVQTVVMRFFGDRGDPQRMLLWGTLLSALAFVSFPLTTNFFQITLTQILLGVSFSFFRVGGLRTAALRGEQLHMVGTATGLFEASFSISQLVGPVLAIIIFGLFGTYTSIMWVAGIITLGATVFYGVISFNKSLEIVD